MHLDKFFYLDFANAFAKFADEICGYNGLYLLWRWQVYH